MKTPRPAMSECAICTNEVAEVYLCESCAREFCEACASDVNSDYCGDCEDAAVEANEADE